MSVYAKKGTLVRLIYLAIAAGWYVVTLGGRVGRGSVVVLCYHGIAHRSRERFRWQIAHIANRAVGAEGLQRAKPYRLGTKPAVCVTFDDAFASLLENALPSMIELGIPATVFAVSGNLGAKPGWAMPPGYPEHEEWVMTPEQMRKGVQDGLFIVGSHSVTHANLADLPLAEARREMAQSKVDLEQICGVPIGGLAFPHGSFNGTIVGAAKAAGYSQVFTLEPKVYAAKDGIRVGRFSMSPEVWRIEYLLTCAGSYSWLQACRRAVRRVRSVSRRPDRTSGTRERSEEG